MVLRRSVSMALTALVLLDACGGGSAGGIRNGHDAAAPGVARRRLDARPALVLVKRDGDPFPAVAFAATTEGGPLAAAATSALLRARLASRGFVVRARPSALGFSLTALVANANDARRLVQLVDGALVQPLTANEPALEAVRTALQSYAGSHFLGPADAAVGACSAELVLPETGRTWDPATAKGQSELGGWLRAAHGAHAAAFAAVGSADVLHAVEDALARTADWPDGDAPEDTWPARDELGVDYATGAAHRLAFALRLPSEDAAARAARALGTPDSTLAQRLEALRPEWRVERAVAVGRPR
ncbi:MAG TPA: hypothetical protein VGQ57_13725, partial [Polyangiaceae bacterium]|nr:hypothetical protein [Polyangiaceae bacterium]